MGILSTLFSKIFPPSHPAIAAADAPSASTAPSASATAPVAMPEVDVEANLDQMAKAGNETLDWRTSIVDLMKLLGLDSSLASRKQLAQELKYNGDMNNSAAMNIWLHHTVMSEVAANGGKVPTELK